ncbi:GNAT family N-acetyltransferase [Microvirga sp. GCM10011540]|uniref:GNAT family N-acetyltransferase n=1 Tax=Microvirga sp. GCM10011540 TaxID=3317338 RepID=UPI00360C6E93
MTAVTAVNQNGVERFSKSARPPIVCEIASAQRFSALEDAWNDLVARAAVPNVSMHPAVALAAQMANKPVHVILAWRSCTADQPPQLVGAWVMTVGRLSSKLPLRVLISPVDSQMVLSTPVIDAEFISEAIAAMLDAVAASPDLPKILRANEFTADGPVGRALEEILEDRNAPAIVQRRLNRPKLQSALDGTSYLKNSLSAQRRSELRRYRRRLSEQGKLEVVCHRAPEEVRRAFEEFLVLEASGWKGRHGSALSQRSQATATFTRSMIDGLARHGLAHVVALRLNGRMVAAQIILRCGRAAFTCKTAYDESLRSHAPGLVLMEDVTTTLLKDPDLDYADSSTNQSADRIRSLADFWTERLDVANLLIDVRKGGTLCFSLLRLKSKWYG